MTLNLGEIWYRGVTNKKVCFTKPLILKDNGRWLGLSERHNHNLCFIIKRCNFQWSYTGWNVMFYINLGNNFEMKPNLFVLKQQLLSFLNYTDKDFFLNEWMSIAIYSHLSMVNSPRNKWLSVSIWKKWNTEILYNNPIKHIWQNT